MNRMLAVVFMLSALTSGGILTWVRSHADRPPSPPELVIIEGPSRHVVTSNMAVASRAMHGRLAPGFARPATDGATYCLDEMLREGPVVLTFIKNGCPCSEAAQPFFNELHAAYPRAAIRGVINVPAEAARRWANRFSVTYPILLDLKGEMVRAYGVENSAYIVLINRRGEIAKHWPGYSESMLRELGALIAEMTGSAERSLTLTDAPTELYTGCPFDF